MRLEKGDGILFLADSKKGVDRLLWGSVDRVREHYNIDIYGALVSGELPWEMWRQTALRESHIFIASAFPGGDNSNLVMPCSDVEYKILVVGGQRVDLWGNEGGKWDITHEYTGLDDYLKTLKCLGRWEEELTAKEYFNWKMGGIKPERFCEGVG